jgi:hypothetical protein
VHVLQWVLTAGVIISIAPKVLNVSQSKSDQT